MDITVSKNKSYFRCPSCGGPIVRRIEEVEDAIKMIGGPECSQCGKQYTIKIAEDLSLEIIERRGC